MCECKMPRLRRGHFLFLLIVFELSDAAQFLVFIGFRQPGVPIDFVRECQYFYPSSLTYLYDPPVGRAFLRHLSCVVNNLERHAVLARGYFVGDENV